jgi:hypothetical protein
MAELDDAIIWVVAEELKADSDELETAVGVVTTGQSTWVFGDEEVLPSSAELQANLALYEALSIPLLSIDDDLAAVRDWEA